jgi:membrane protein implicated in regulation of membrane protease activity
MDIASTVGFLALVIIGILIILLILRVVWMLLPAAIIAIIVYFLTYNLWYAGVAFLVIAVITVLAGILRR